MLEIVVVFQLRARCVRVCWDPPDHSGWWLPRVLTHAVVDQVPRLCQALASLGKKDSAHILGITLLATTSFSRFCWPVDGVHLHLGYPDEIAKKRQEFSARPLLLVRVVKGASTPEFFNVRPCSSSDYCSYISFLKDATLIQYRVSLSQRGLSALVTLRPKPSVIVSANHRPTKLDAPTYYSLRPSLLLSARKPQACRQSLLLPGGVGSTDIPSWCRLTFWTLRRSHRPRAAAATPNPIRLLPRARLRTYPSTVLPMTT